MVNFIKPRNGVMRGKRNVMRGGNVTVLLDRLNGKTPIMKDHDTRTFEEPVTGGNISMIKSNKVGGLPNSKRSRAVAVARIVEPARAKVGSFGGAGLEEEEKHSRLANSLKIPMSFRKNKEKRNNIKLVL